MSKFDVKIGDIVHTQIGIGEVIAISKTKETLMVKMDDGRKCAIRLEYVKDVFDNYRDDI
jgi:preprotein translocase subunit YajC